MTEISPQNLKKILYIEDTDDSRLLVRRLLARDYLLLESNNPIDGIDLAINTNPDLILLDINLPDMSGREVATRLSVALPNTPIVALTADATGDARERALVAGCIGFMTKPIEIDTFREEVKAYLNGKREVLHNRDRHMKAYHEELVEHLERKVHELTRMADQKISGSAKQACHCQHGTPPTSLTGCGFSWAQYHIHPRPRRTTPNHRQHYLQRIRILLCWHLPA